MASPVLPFSFDNELAELAGGSGDGDGHGLYAPRLDKKPAYHGGVLTSRRMSRRLYFPTGLPLRATSCAGP